MPCGKNVLSRTRGRRYTLGECAHCRIRIFNLSSPRYHDMMYLYFTVPASRHHRPQLRRGHVAGDPGLPQAGELPRHRHVVQAALGRPQAQEQRRRQRRRTGKSGRFSYCTVIYHLHSQVTVSIRVSSFMVNGREDRIWCCFDEMS